MERLKPKAIGELFLQHYPVDKNGFSKIALMEDLVKINPSFKTTNGCDWARSHTSWLEKQFLIERVKRSGRIYSVQLVGYNKKAQNHNIPQYIKNYYKNKKCAILDTSQQIEVDHKNARYDKDNLNIEDF